MWSIPQRLSAESVVADTALNNDELAAPNCYELMSNVSLNIFKAGLSVPRLTPRSNAKAKT
jgi:hypothetical protein